MKLINDQFFEGERPLFGTKNTRFENVKFYPGESAMKESSNLVAYQCNFMGKYPFWHSRDISIESSLFTIYSRAAIWYSSYIRMVDSVVEAPKMFRKCSDLIVQNTIMPNALECFWYCTNIELKNVEVHNGDYIFMNSSDIKIDGFKLQGNYSFQDAKNVEIRNSHIDSRDALWETENVTVYDSYLEGEFLGWHSKNLRLVNCTIKGTQPLCYVDGLIMENCLMIETDFCFEYSTINVQINGDIQSVRNPKGGLISAKNIGKIIIDENCIDPGNCKILLTEEVIC